VLGHARDIIARVDATGDSVARFLSGEVGRIDIGTFQSVSNVLLPAILQRLRRDHPNVDIRLFEDDDKEAGTARVLAGELDVTFTVGQRNGNLESLLLLDDPFVLVTPPGELPDGPYPTADLDGVPLIGYPPSACQEDIENGLRACGAEPTFVFRTLDNGAQVAMVKAGMGWAVMPLLAVNTSDPEISMHALSPAIPPRQICLVWRRDRTLSPVAARMVDLALEVAGEIRQLPLSA
jgi:DNA-binding transcriptional LysR family regulator